MSGFDINTVTISGNLTRDPELRNLPSGNSVCNLRIAHNERFKGADGEWADRPQYFDITVWSGFGEYLAKERCEGAWRRQRPPTVARSCRRHRACGCLTAGSGVRGPPARRRPGRATESRPAVAHVITLGRAGRPAPRRPRCRRS